MKAKISETRSKLSVLVVAALVSVAVWVASCGKSSSAPAAPRTYNGAGSLWAATLNPDNTFVLTYAPSVTAAVTATINGTYATNPSISIIKLTVTAASGSGTSLPNVGDTAFALEIPGVVLFVKPIVGNGPLIAMVNAGTCPTAAISDNFIKVKAETSDLVTNSTPVIGQFTFDPNAKTASVSNQYRFPQLGIQGTTNATTAPTVQPPVPAALATAGSTIPFTGVSCGSGLVSGLGGAEMVMTSGGGALVNINSGQANQQILMALPAPSTAPSVTSLAGNYWGVAFTRGSDVPVNMILGTSDPNVAAGTIAGAGFQVTDASNGSTSSSTANGVYIRITGAGPTAGTYVGEVCEDHSSYSCGGAGGTAGASPNNIQPLTCIAQANAGGSNQNILACAALNYDKSMTSFVAVSHP